MSHPGSRGTLPERIGELGAVAANLSWSWNADARALFRSIDPDLWNTTQDNPVALLRQIDPARLTACASDPDFLRRYDAVQAARAREATSAGTWCATTHPVLTERSVAYFCAEFGLHSSLPIYSGGLGILAGDHCKAASDLGVPLVGVGLFYARGYADQRVRSDGWQEDAEQRFDPSATPLQRVLDPRGDPCLATVRMSGREVRVGVWRVMVGRVPILLLDTDLEGNDPADREVSQRLYAGGPDLRVRQEWILGVGGVRVLRALGYAPVAWHANEGHAAFMLVERVRELTASGTSFPDAVRAVRARSLFTTHTPVPAGHDVFSLEQVEQCAGPLWRDMGISREEFVHLGAHPALEPGRFHMAVTAIRLSARVNGVARRHGEESRRMWNVLWPDREAARVPIGYVTNGVHVPTWMASEMTALGAERDLNADTLWAVHGELKSRLLRSIPEQARLRHPDALTIGFGRRFATYKRADLIFRDPERLQRLLGDPSRPVQLLFTGKAHPADEPGKKILQRVYQFARDPRFEGRIAFLEDYDMRLARSLVQGVDLWLNVPRLPLEACGTSGMKAALNGVPQLSTLDGWWVEGYDGQNGWAIPSDPNHRNDDAADSEALYRSLETDVVPLYYDRDVRGVPRGWVDRMTRAMAVAGEQFNAERMVRQYVTEYYVPAMRAEVSGDDPPTA